MHISTRAVNCTLYIMNELQIYEIKNDEIALLAQFLKEKGYSSSEIKSAMFWLIDRKNSLNESFEATGGSRSSYTFRVLNEIESSIITPPAHGYLIQLLELGLISEIELERVLERATSFGLASVGIREIEAIASVVLLETDRIPHGTFYHYDHSIVGH